MIQLFKGWKHNSIWIEEAARLLGRHDLFDIKLDMGDVDKSRPLLFPIHAGGMWNFSPSTKEFDVFDRSVRGAENYLGAENTFLCLDISGEGFPIDDATLRNLHKELGNFHLNPKRVIVFTSSVDAPRDYNEWCHSTGTAPAFEPVPLQVQLYFYAGQYQNHRKHVEAVFYDSLKSLTCPNPRKHKFLTLNYTPRPNRYAVVLNLIAGNHVKDGLISFHGPKVDNASPIDNMSSYDSENAVLDMLAHLELDPTTLKQIGTLHSLAPLIVDERSSRTDYAYAVPDPFPYLNSYLSIVTESDYTAASGLRITEKVLKAIANCHPFILVGAAGSLALLKSLGFKTFAPIFDESYDLEPSPPKRMRMVLAEIDRVLSLPLNEIRIMYEQLWSVVLHNFTLFHFGSGQALLQDPAFKFATGK